MSNGLVTKDPEISVEESSELIEALALPLIRLDTIDSFDRMGYSTTQIAREMLLDPASAIHYEDIISRAELSPTEQMSRVVKQINGDLKHLRNQRQLQISPSQVQDALIEYLGREDRIYQQAWMDHGLAPDYDTKIKALGIAQESARNKARALGVGVDRQTMTRKRSAKIPIDMLESPDKLAELVNAVQGQMDITNNRVLELKEEVTIEGSPIDPTEQPDS